MEIAVTSAEMQAIDRYAIGKLKIPGLLLMENAGRGTVEMMERHFGSLKGKSIVIICGKGNNGGDGYVAARHLLNRGAGVTVIILCDPSDLKGDAKVNFGILDKLSDIGSKRSVLRIQNINKTSKLSMLPKADIIVDAIFGTGFSGDVKPPYKEIIERINRFNCKKVSIDIPSGLDADNGEVKNVAVKADLTVTMGLKKIGLISGSGINYTGIIEVIDITIPKKIEAINKSETFIVDNEDVVEVIPARLKNSHKHSVGKIFVLAGSRGLTGAAALTSETALRAGAGAVVLGTPASVYPILAKKLTEVMVEPLPETESGTLSLTAYDKILNHIDWADLVICGPGISRNKETCELIWKIFCSSTKKVLIDADGLNNLSERVSILKKQIKGDVIITPHTGELSRLLRLSSGEIERNRVTVARRTAKEFGLTVVLKGAPTVTADRKGNVFINSTGNPGMATAGMGDVLAGLIGGLWVQGMGAAEAAYAGVYLHGRAGDIAENEFGGRSLLATDVLNSIYKAILKTTAGI